MTVNTFNVSCIITCASLSIFSCSQKSSDKTSDNQPNEKTKPNIIYIMADDMGYGDLGCYGQEKIKTPHIDQMAKEGMKFLQHYAGSAVCAPSRAVLMTGKHTGHCVVRGNKQAKPSGQMPLPDNIVTVAELMKSAGYTTGMIGKWGLGNVSTSGNPNMQGWDYFYGYTDQVLAHNYYPEYLIRNGKKEYLQNEVKYLDSTEWHKGLGSYAVRKVEYSNDLFAEDAITFINKNKNKPFFLYLPFTIPHDNGEAPKNETQEVPDLGIYAEKDWELQEAKNYAAIVTRLDSYVGKIRLEINKLGLDNNTLIIFTSDNGPMPEERHPYTKFLNSNGNLRGGKLDLYEGGIRMPLIAVWKNTIAPNVTTNHISAFWDFLPTACEIAGVTPPKDIDGISYLPTLLGQEEKQKNHEYLYFEFYQQGNKQAIRMGKWKGIRLNVYENSNAPVELYNLEVDETESVNIADQHPDIVNDILLKMETAHTSDSNWKLFKNQDVMN